MHSRAFLPATRGNFPRKSGPLGNGGIKPFRATADVKDDVPGNIGVTRKTTEWTATRPEEFCSEMPVRGCLAQRHGECVGHGAGDLDAAVGERGGVRVQRDGRVLVAHELLEGLDVAPDAMATDANVWRRE